VSFVLIDIGEVKRKPSHWVFRAPRFARSLAGAETLDSQSSTLASPWQGAYGFKEPPGSLRNLLITDSIDSYRLNLNNRHSKPFSPVTPAQPPSRPGRSASAAEAATRQPNGGARVAYYSRKLVRMQWRTIFRDHGEAIKTSGSDLTSLRDKFNEKDSDGSGQVDAEELGKLIPVSVGTL